MALVNESLHSHAMARSSNLIFGGLLNSRDMPHLCVTILFMRVPRDTSVMLLHCVVAMYCCIVLLQCVVALRRCSVLLRCSVVVRCSEYSAPNRPSSFLSVGVNPSLSYTEDSRNPLG